MSNPISTLHDAKAASDDHEDTAGDARNVDLASDAPAATQAASGEAEIEVEDDEEKELTAAAAPGSGATAEEQAQEEAAVESGEERGEAPSKRGRAMLALVLGVLLLVSVAINLKQSRDIAQLEARNGEYEQALAAAVDRIDSEAARAQSAEAALDRVDAAVDVVNERVVGLQEALDQLREATVR